MIAASTTILDCPPEKVWQEVQTSRLLMYVTAPLLSFAPLQPAELPPVWAETRYLVSMRLFGWIPIGRQWIVISKPVVQPTPGRRHYQIRDNGHGDLIRTWDHRIVIQETADGRSHYADIVEVRAGLLTPLIWAAASIFYRYRQYRWRRKRSPIISIIHGERNRYALSARSRFDHWHRQLSVFTAARCAGDGRRCARCR